MDRRTFIAAGAAAGLLPAEAGTTRLVIAARPKSPLFTHGPLAANPVAANFQAVPRGLVVPDTVLLSASGNHTFRDLRGKVRLVALWAEWCGACLLALPDLLKLHQRYGGATFEVLAVLTSSFARLDLSGANATLAKVHAAGLPLWIEPRGGQSIGMVLASDGGTPMLPCDLLVDAEGRIRGRSFGTTLADVKVDLDASDIVNGELTASGKAKLAEAEAAAAEKPQRSGWATPEADAFVKALADGALG